MQLLSHDLGVDLGTANVLIYVDNQGVVVREPSVVAVDKNTGKIIQVGAAARNMLGRTPGNVVAMHPLKDGVISDHEMTVQMLRELFKTAAKTSLFAPKPRVVISVPSGVTEVEERTVINAAIEAGARRVYLIEEPLAAGLGAGLDLRSPKGHMVVNIGCGTTDAAILTMNGVASSASIKVAGNAFDEAIIQHVRKKHALVISKATAEDVKIQIGAVIPRPENYTMTIKGREPKSGIPRETTVTSEEIAGALFKAAKPIVELVASMVETTTTELSGDLADNGITLTGGGSLLWGMDALLTEAAGVPCTVADDAESCVAYGCGKSLAWINQMQEGPINIAKKRLMRE